MKNKQSNSDYTQMYLKAFLGLFVIAVYTAGACTVMSLLKAYGMGGVYPVYMGSALLLLGILAVLIVVLARSYARPFRCIDRQLDALLQNEDSPIQLPEGLASTDQKLNALKQAMEKRLFSAQMAEQQKNELVMYLAHDIRTPLTSVIGYLSLLDEARDMPEEQREKYTHITLEKANKLEKMINEFFEITRYSLQQIQLNRENLDLCYMLVQLTDELLPVLAKNGNTPVVQMETEDITLYGDGEKLARVFANILKNAAAYSEPHTEIVIEARQRGEMVEINFTNRGREIPQEQLDRMFDKFYRMDEARSGDNAGAGLGLAIAKEIVTLHGGTIRAASKNNTVTISVQIPGGKSSG